MADYQKLHLSTGQYLAYHKFSSKHKNNFCVIFLSGFMSNMEGGKAVFLQKICEEMDVNYIRFDYSGTGHSSGGIIDGSISGWKENAKAIIEQLSPDSKNIIIGSSMGGWISALLALEIPEKISSLITIAAAPDFTEELIWKQLDATAQNEILTNGLHKLPTEYCNDNGEQAYYPITKLLIEDGRKHMLLANKTININIPVTLIHGMNDLDVPYHFSMDLAEKITSFNVELILQPKGKHRMSEPADLSLLQQVLEKHIML